MASTSDLHAPQAAPLSDLTDQADDQDNSQAWGGLSDQESEEDQSLPATSQQVCLSPFFSLFFNSNLNMGCRNHYNMGKEKERQKNRQYNSCVKPSALCCYK